MTEVLVVGAGPVGLVLACDLARQGVPVRVVDAATGATPHSRAIVVWPRTLELLRRIGVTEQMCASGHRLDAVSFYSAHRRLGAVQMAAMADTPYPFALTLPQTQTERILRERLAELGGAVERGTGLTALSGSDNAPRATLRTATGGVEQVTASWLIGADGAGSQVRAELGVGFEPRGREVLFAIGDGTLSGDQLSQELVYSYSRTAALGIAPLQDGAFRIAFSVPEWPVDAAPPQQLFQQMIDELAPRPGRFTDLRWSTVFRAQRRTASAFRAGRCFLAGDAAHVFSAAGAQGMNTGIQDAVALAWRLGGVIRGHLDAQVLDTYEPERRGAVERVSRNTTLQTEWGLLSRRRAVLARDGLVRLAGRTGILQRLGAPLISQIDVEYGSTRAVPWRLRDAVRPGARFPAFCPDPGTDPAAGADPAARWPVLQPDRLTVLAWTGQPRDRPWRAHVAYLAADLDGRAAVQDVAGWPGLRPLLGAAPAAVVVRPDGHVAAVVERARADGVQAAVRAAGAGRAPAPATDRVPA